MLANWPKRELNFVVQHRVLQPVGIEHFGARTDQAAGVGDAAQVVGADVGATLPQAGDVEGEAFPTCQFSEINVHGAADTIPSSGAGLDGCLRCVQEIGNIEEIEGYALLFCQLRSLSAPVTEKILLVPEILSGQEPGVDAGGGSSLIVARARFDSSFLSDGR